jgi:hypothetical protein
VPAGRIGKEQAVSFLKTPFPEIVHLVRFALADGHDREPAAAFTAAAAGTVCGSRRGWSHSLITV